MRNCPRNPYVTRHPRGWGCVVAYELQNKMHIYPLYPNMPGNVDYYSKTNEDLKAHFINEDLKTQFICPHFVS